MAKDSHLSFTEMTNSYSLMSHLHIYSKGKIVFSYILWLCMKWHRLNILIKWYKLMNGCVCMEHTCSSKCYVSRMDNWMDNVSH